MPHGGVALAVAARVVMMMMAMMRGVRVMRAMVMIRAEWESARVPRPAARAELQELRTQDDGYQNIAFQDSFLPLTSHVLLRPNPAVV